MSVPKYHRNFKIVELRLKDPKRWTFRAIQARYKFKSPGTVAEIFKTFLPKYEALRTYPQKKGK